MSDGFDFRPEPPRREARQFEPPPWERDAFEQHRREQEAKERAERERAEAERQALLAQLEATGAATVAPERTAEAPADEAHGTGGQGAQAEEAEEPKLDDRQVEAMMLELKAEEPPTFTQVWAVAVGAGVVVGLIGIVISIWGLAALAKVGSIAGPGGAVLVLFGIGFAGVGGWLIYTGLQRRGVL